MENVRSVSDGSLQGKGFTIYLKSPYWVVTYEAAAQKPSQTFQMLGDALNYLGITHIDNEPRDTF